ncbi:hypothetical protein AB1Y20_000358 [Prymnesium parvum]|uniref:AB hydrolase-1 domain-containing protein n=1 Tax=Prymnesium parvum TaxID=97485 RepID=A0AB34K4N2_PRYPA
MRSFTPPVTVGLKLVALAANARVSMAAQAPPTMAFGRALTAMSSVLPKLPAAPIWSAATLAAPFKTVQQFLPGAPPAVNVPVDVPAPRWDSAPPARRPPVALPTEKSDHNNSAIAALGVLLSLVMRAISLIGVSLVLAPLSGYLSTLVFGWAGVHNPLHWLPSWQPTSLAGHLVATWLTFEGLFLAACCAFARWMTHRRPAPRLLDSERREQLWRRVLHDPSQQTGAFVASWFTHAAPARRLPELLAHAVLLLDWGRASLTGAPPAPRTPRTPVRYEELALADVMSWASWGLFERPMAQLDEEEVVELRALVAALEQSAGAPLRTGSSGVTPKGRQMLRDEVLWQPRPLLYYALTHAVGKLVLTPATMAGAGFIRHPSTPHREWSYYSREPTSKSPSRGWSKLALRQSLRLTASNALRHAKLAAKVTMRSRRASLAMGYPRFGVRAAGGREVRPQGDSASPAIEAWRSSATGARRATEERVAVVFIHGVGVGPAPYINLFKQLASDGKPLIALEIGQVSQRINYRAPPKPAEFCEELQAVLDQHGMDKCIIAGHSFGSTYAACFSRLCPERVVGTVLLDPICCCMHHFTGARFVYKEVHTLLDVIEEYFIRRELFTSAVVARHLRWHEAGYWLEDSSPSRPTHIILSEDDEIVPVASIQSTFGSMRARENGTQVTTLRGIGHGGWLMDADACERIASAIASYGAMSQAA